MNNGIIDRFQLVQDFATIHRSIDVMSAKMTTRPRNQLNVKDVWQRPKNGAFLIWELESFSQNERAYEIKNGCFTYHIVVVTVW